MSFSPHGSHPHPLAASGDPLDKDFVFNGTLFTKFFTMSIVHSKKPCSSYCLDTDWCRAYLSSRTHNPSYLGYNATFHNFLSFLLYLFLGMVIITDNIVSYWFQANLYGSLTILMIPILNGSNLVSKGWCWLARESFPQSFIYTCIYCLTTEPIGFWLLNLYLFQDSLVCFPT